MSDAVQQIKDRLNIIDVVSPYVELHKAGKHFKGKSPFSNERTPSFHVSPERGMYYCFSTNQGGDIFTFIQVMEGVDFRGALKLLAEKANVELTPEAPGRKTVRDRHYAALEAATEWFAQQLPNSADAKAYLRDRGVHAETIAAWRIGYAPGPPDGGWRELRTALREQGFTDEELFAVGLIKQPGEGKDPFDVFRDRIMFPMADTQGRIVAFSGRLLHPNDKAPKYVNSPETDLYKKSELLYGYHKAKHNIRQLPFWLIAEGQFDVVMAHQAGYSNTVAVSGTALTTQHVQQLERLCERVVLALDADRAGIAAMQKAATVMLARGLDLKVAALPEGKDPADLVAEDSARLKQCVGAATHVIEFMLIHLKDTSNDDRTYKLRVREELLPYLVLIPNKIDQDHFVTMVAERTGTTADAIRHEVTRLEERAVREERPVTAAPEPATPSADNQSAETKVDRYEELLAYLLAAVPLIPEAWSKRLERILETEIAHTYETARAHVSSDTLPKLTFIIEQEFAEMKEAQQASELADRLNQLKDRHIRREFARCREQLRVAEQVGDEAAESEAMQTLQTWYSKRSAEPYTAADLMSG